MHTKFDSHEKLSGWPVGHVKNLNIAIFSHTINVIYIILIVLLIELDLFVPFFLVTLTLFQGHRSVLNGKVLFGFD